MTRKFAERTREFRASEIREILKVTEQPEIISFAGGLPAPETFPAAALRKVTESVLSNEASKALQYAPSEGFLPLRAAIASRLNSVYSINTTPDGILPTAGSQQAMDLTARILLNPGDVVLCERPTYLGALSAFRTYGALCHGVACDEDGMLPQALEEALKIFPSVRMIYVIPDFQNPTGRTWSLERRKALMAVADREDIWIMEDNPYGELRYEGHAMPTLKSMDTAGRVIYLGTFSKTLCPGLRMGWMTASQEVIATAVLAKQAADLQTATLAQRQVAGLLASMDYDRHLDSLREIYRRRRDTMIRTLRAFLPDWKVNSPQGGLFCWVTLPDGVPAAGLLPFALAEKVAFVPGSPFFTDGGGADTLRLNFSNTPEEGIREGVQRLARAMARDTHDLHQGRVTCGKYAG